MKLSALLVPAFVQGDADCSEDNSLFSLTCLGDFKVKLTVENAACFAEKYPELTIADLVIFDDNDSAVTDSDTCTAFSTGASGSNYFYSDTDLTAAVDSSSTELYFDGKVCASDATWDGSSLSYSANFGSYLSGDNDPILYNTEMLATTLTCNYNPDVSKDIDLDGTQLDSVEDPKKVQDPTDAGELEITTTVFTQGSSGTYAELAENTDVILGQGVKVAFFSSFDFLNIHVQNCKATDKATGWTNDIDLVVNDCFKSGSAALTQISPQAGTTTCNAGVDCQTEILFNQFAFVDPTATTTTPTLSFHMECEIAVGEAECADGRRRRRQVSETQVETVSFDYEVNITDKPVEELDGGIVVVLESTESSSTTAAVTFAGLIFAML